jgi:hypothetical protein
MSMARVDEIIAEVQEADRERRQIEVEQNERANAKLKWLFDQLNLPGARLAYGAKARQGGNGIDVEVWRFSCHLCSLTKHEGTVRLSFPQGGSEVDFASEDDALRRAIEILHTDFCKRPSVTPDPIRWYLPEPYSILTDYQREIDERADSIVRSLEGRSPRQDARPDERHAPKRQEGQEGPRS